MECPDCGAVFRPGAPACPECGIELAEVAEVVSAQAVAEPAATIDLALADLAQHPDSSAREIGNRIGRSASDVFNALDRAAYQGLCQRWRDSGPGWTWFWELPVAHDCKADR
jgi:hypothetical protein